MNIEQLIDDQLELFSADDGQPEKRISAVEETFKQLFIYLDTEYGDDLNDQEFEMVLFPILIILSCLIELDESVNLDMDTYLDVEEESFKTLEENNSVDAFGYPTDFRYIDLIYFVEDYIEGLEEEGINKVILNIIYVVSTSLVKAM